MRCADDLYEIREQTLHAVEDQVALAENLPGGESIRVHVDRVDEADTGAVNCSARSCGRSPPTSWAAPRPSRVWITLTRDGLSVSNDGARGDELPALSGLAALRERPAGHGGELEMEQDGTGSAPSRRCPSTAPTPFP